MDEELYRFIINFFIFPTPYLQNSAPPPLGRGDLQIYTPVPER